MRIVLKRAAQVVAIIGVVVALLLVLCVVQARQRETGDAVASAPRTGQRVHADDVEMFVQAAGPASGPVVLLVHGTGAWSQTWRPTLEALGAAGFRAIALDLPPFGYSSRPASGVYDKATQGRRIVAAMDALQIGSATLVGHSFGGGPTVEAAMQVPERVRGLVLVDAALNLHTGEAPALPAAARMILSCGPLRDALVAAFLTNPMFTPRLLRAFVARDEAVTDARVRIYQEPLSLRGTTAAYGRWLPYLMQAAPGARSENPAQYRQLTMPMVAIWGALDTITPLDQAQALVAAAPNAHLVVMPDVGHIPQIEDTDGFNRRLLDSLASL